MFTRHRSYIIGLTAILIGQFLFAVLQVHAQVRSERETCARRRVRLSVSHSKTLANNTREHSNAIFLAAGANAFERIYNSDDLSIVELIERIADEASPPGWKVNVTVDEFTHFLLLVHTNTDTSTLDVTTVEQFMLPVVEYCRPYLRDIAIYDNSYRCVLFFEEADILGVEQSARLDAGMMVRAQARSHSFREFDATQVQFRMQNGHMYVDAVVGGPFGDTTVTMLLDTGAGASVLTPNVAQATGGRSWAASPTRTYGTVNGSVPLPVVNRTITIGGLQRHLEVAVSGGTGECLLGVDFFDGVDYTISSEERCIFVWPHASRAVVPSRSTQP